VTFCSANSMSYRLEHSVSLGAPINYQLSIHLRRNIGTPLQLSISAGPALSLFIIGLWTNCKHRFSASAPLVIDHRPGPKAHNHKLTLSRLVMSATLLRASSQSTGLNRAGPMSRWRGIARPSEKSVRTPSQPAFRPSIERLPLYAESEAGALVPNTRLFRRPCDAPPAVTWAPPSAGAEKWEKWRKWLACQKYESDGPADCTVAFARRRRRRNDDDKGSISTFGNQFSTTCRAPHNL
jgi:hypothetical protein